MADDNDFGDYLKAAAVLAVAVAASAAVNSALAGKQKNAVQSYPLNQPIMPVNNFVGDYSKSPGGYVFRQKVSNNFATIQAISEGRLDSIAAYYLSDDKVTINGGGSVDGVTNGGTTITDGRYQDDDGKIRVKIQTRLGLPTETAYSDFTAAFPSIWDSTCRGDNTGSIAVQRFAADAKFQSQIFPAGAVDASVVARGVFYDWRDETQDRLDDTTWKWCANPVVNLVHKEWMKWGRDWTTQILPLLDDLTIEADYCDTPFAKKAGGTEPIYAVAFNYPDDEDFTVTRQRILDSMDGFYCEDGYGRLILKAGRYEEPDLTFGGDDIFASHWEGGELSSDAVDLINISFVSPENDYKVVQCDPWIINEGGILSSDMTVDGVYQLPQARYLAKRKSARLMPNFRGWIRVGRKGRQALKRRYIRVQNPRRPSMNDVACEITGIEYDPTAREFTINLISADPNIDSWNPATEEGDPVDAVPGVDPGLLDAPVIDTVTPFYDGANVRLSIIGDYPLRSDLTPVSSWRVPGGIWNDTTNTDFVDNGGGSFTTNTGVVISASSLETRIAYITGGGSLSPWSTTYTVNSSVVPTIDLSAYGAATYKAYDGTTYPTYAAMVAASKATFSRASVSSALTQAGYPPVQFISGAPSETNRGLLIDRSRTNLLLNSATLATQSITVTAQAYTISFYGAGSITLSGTATGTITGLGTGLRKTYTFTPTAGSLTLTVSGSALFANLEAGDYATAWIPTTGTTVARAADVASITGLSALFANPFTVVVEAELQAQGTAGSAYIMTVSDNTNNNRLSAYRSDAGGASTACIAGGVAQDTYAVSVGTTPQVIRIALALGATTYNSAINGVADTLTTGITHPAGLDRIYFGSSATGGNAADGYIRRVTIYPAEFSASQLAQLTA